MKLPRLIGLGMVLFSTFTLSSCKKDPCKNVTCQNGGICQEGSCKCSLPWEGSKCEVDARDKFSGAWRGTGNCAGGSGPSEVTATITKSSVVPLRIIIENVYGELTSSTTFTIPTQTIDNGGTPATVNGSGTLNGSQLTMTVVVSVGGVSTTCTYTLTKL